MHEQPCRIGLIHPIRQKFLYFEKTRMSVVQMPFRIIHLGLLGHT